MTTSVKLPEAKLAPPGEKSDPLRPRIGLWLGPLAFLGILLFLDLDPQNPAATRMVAGSCSNNSPQAMSCFIDICFRLGWLNSDSSNRFDDGQLDNILVK